MRQSKKNRTKRRQRPGCLGSLLIGLCVCVIVGAGYLMARQYIEYRVGEDAYGELARGLGLDVPPSTGSEEKAAVDGGTERILAPPDGWPSVDFEALARVNPDVAGWLIVPGTEINYPVVNAPDNEYYLKRLFNQRANDAGTLFFDARNQRGLQDTNTVIYGHNMKNGTMFQAITRYKDQSYFDDHPRAYLMTPQARYVIELFAGYVSSIDDDSWQRAFDSERAYAEWIERVRKKSTFVSPVQMDASAQCVTLSTCSYEYDNARYVAIGKLTRVD